MSCGVWHDAVVWCMRIQLLLAESVDYRISGAIMRNRVWQACFLVNPEYGQVWFGLFDVCRIKPLPLALRVHGIALIRLS